MKTTYIYRITDERTDSCTPARYIYAASNLSARLWQHENCPEIRAKFECIGTKNVPIAGRAQEFSFQEYQAINQHFSDLSNPETWKRFISKTR